HGEWFSPVSLAGKQPVTQTVGNSGLANVLFLQPLDHLRFSCLGIKAIEVNRVVRGVDYGAVFQPRSFMVLGHGNRSDDVDVKGFRKVPVSIVLGWNSHDGSRPVSHEDVVGNEHGDLLAVNRVGGIHTSEHTRLLTRVVSAFGLCLGPYPDSVSGHG